MTHKLERQASPERTNHANRAMSKARFLCRAIGVVAILATLHRPAPAMAQTSASPLATQKPVTIVVPFAPGGGTDILARVIADKLGKITRATIIIDNRPGANGLIATQVVERAKPDGHTLMFGSSSTHVIAPLLSADAGAVDALRRSFVFLAVAADTPLVLAVAGTSSSSSLNDFVKSAASEKTYGTFGVNSSAHLAGSLLASKTSARLLHVPYKGSAPAVTDLLGGTIDSVILTVAAVRSYIDGKQVRALAVTGRRRVSGLTDVPTLKEMGFDGFENSGWFGLFAPARTTSNVIEYWRSAMNEVMAQETIKLKLVELGLQESSTPTGAEAALWDHSIAETRAILRSTAIDVDKNTR